MWKKEKGASLLIVSIVVTLLLLLSATFLTTISKQNRVIVSQERLSKSYYISETGIHNAFNYILENIEYVSETPASPDKEPKNNNGKGNENGNANSNSNSNKTNNGKGFGKCNNRGKSIIHNPHCKPNSDDPLSSEEDYTILHKSIEKLFEEVYTEDVEVSWEVAEIEPNVFLVTSIGYYGQAKTTLSCEFEVTSDNLILVHYLIEL